MFFITHVIAMLSASVGFVIASAIVEKFEVPWFYILMFMTLGIALSIHVLIMDSIIHSDDDMVYWVDIFTTGIWPGHHNTIGSILTSEMWKTDYRKDWFGD